MKGKDGAGAPTDDVEAPKPRTESLQAQAGRLKPEHDVLEGAVKMMEKTRGAVPRTCLPPRRCLAAAIGTGWGRRPSRTSAPICAKTPESPSGKVGRGTAAGEPARSFTIYNRLFIRFSFLKKFTRVQADVLLCRHKHNA